MGEYSESVEDQCRRLYEALNALQVNSLPSVSKAQRAAQRLLLAHSVSPETLADGGLERLIDGYLEALASYGVRGYERGTAMRHFHLATVDYARFVVSRFWAAGSTSAEAFAKRAANPNVCLPNRDVDAALRFAERVDEALTTLDGGGGTCC